MRLTSLGGNPTKVWLASHNRTRAVLLQKGECCYACKRQLCRATGCCLPASACSSGGGQAWAPAPPVTRARPPPLLASAGESRILAAGDRVLLLGSDDSMFVDVAAAHHAHGTAGAAGTAADAAGGAAGGAPADGGEQGDAEPPSKRARAEGSAPAAPSSEQQQQVAGGAAGAGAAAAAAAGAGPVMLVLVGAQGSGKSTLCENLQRAAEQAATGRRWVRVNQDTIAGKRVGWGECG